MMGHDPIALNDFVRQVDDWASHAVPFFFLIDFEMKKPVAIPLDRVSQEEILFDFNGLANTPREINGYHRDRVPQLTGRPIELDLYRKKFDQVVHAINYGDSYLANLTIRTKITLDCTPRDVFFSSKAKYRLWYRDEFVVFSPETFVRIEAGKISTFPMKGTIDASLPDAANRILEDVKEMAEHVTIVDLLRNDLSAVADNVKVTRFRYIDEIVAADRRLLQVSSEIVGDLHQGYQSRLGEILVGLLPAGSISGAPKRKTLEVLRSAEEEDRGYYTGIAGVFDGRRLDSGVMIRFIESRAGEFFYRSGGGITAQSLLEKEYDEVIAKVYVPVN